MALIAPSEGFVGPKFKQPVKTTPPLTEFDPAYIRRKAQVPEQIFRLKNGKQFSYFTEGRIEDPALVCFPGSGFGKWMFVPREPLQGVFLIAIDDMGHGLSSPLEDCPVFSESVAEVCELLDGLNIDKFFVCGHSRGGAHAMQCAAALPERVLGCAVLSTPCDIFHPSVSKQERKRLDEKGAMALNSAGCMSCFVRSMLKGSYYHPDKSVDFGFAGKGSCGFTYYKSKETGGAPKAMDSDHFFVTKLLDAELHGANSDFAVLFELQGLFRRWSYDVAEIRCPTFLYVETKGEVPVSNMEKTHSLIQGSKLVVMPEHGHCSILMEFEKIATALLRGEEVPQGSFPGQGSHP